MATSTPWGKADYSKSLARGVTFYGTPGHGGFKVSNGLLKAMHQAFRDHNYETQRGWFEEDCLWSFVALAFPSYFSEDQIKGAHAICKNYYPFVYQTVLNTTVALSESHRLREIDFANRTRDKLVCVSAVNSDKHPGMVEVTACLGGRDPETYRYCGELRTFLVPRDDYRNNNEESFVVDPDKYAETIES